MEEIEHWLAFKGRPGYRDRNRHRTVPLEPFYASRPQLGHGNAGFRQRTVDYSPTTGLYNTVKFNPAFHRYDGSTFMDYGGPFWSEKVTMSAPKPLNGRSWIYEATGPHYPTQVDWEMSQAIANTKLVMPDLGSVPYEMLISEGATGIARTIPTLPEVSLSGVLGEMREGLPSVPFTKNLSGTRAVTGEFLNYMFGIAPTLSDSKDVYSFLQDYDANRIKFHSMAEKLLHRRKTLIDHSGIVEDTLVSGWPKPMPVANVCREGAIRTVVEKSTKIWFSGAYSYTGLVQIDAHIDRLRDFARQSGLIPGYDTVWQLSPYSWLAGWFTNMTDCIRAISALGRDGLIMHYGYIMGKTTITRNTSWTGYVNHEGSWELETINCKTEAVYKQRWRAYPFGFGLKYSDLDPKQLAILAALGYNHLTHP